MKQKHIQNNKFQMGCFPLQLKYTEIELVSLEPQGIQVVFLMNRTWNELNLLPYCFIVCQNLVVKYFPQSKN